MQKSWLRNEDCPGLGLSLGLSLRQNLKPILQHGQGPLAGRLLQILGPLLSALIFFSALGGANVLAEDQGKEEYLPIPELSYPTQKKAVDDDYSIFDDVRLHAGAAFINSFQDYLIAPGVRERGGVRGVQINFGVDLFSEHWIVEGDLVSIPQSPIDDTTISENGFELRLNYETPILEGVTVHAGAGVASRNYNITTSARPAGGVTAGSSSFSSGASVIEGGADYWVSGQLSAGLELGTHIPMANGTDPSSVDLAIRVNGHF